MISIKLSPNDIYKGDLILINRTYPIKIDEGEVISNLEVVDSRFQEHKANKYIVGIVNDIFKKLNSYDEIIPVSCFRSRQEQEQLYNDSIIENGIEFTRKYVAFPDSSEHQSGLAVDLGKNKKDIDFICPEFPYYGIFSDFRLEAVKNGFVERYKKGKESITGISHEPWHFRYVGVPHSAIMEEKDFSLEEYHQFIKGFDRPENSYIYRDKDYMAKIFYIKSNGERQQIEIENDYEYNISGNNIDGFIITLFKNFN